MIFKKLLPTLLFICFETVSIVAMEDNSHPPTKGCPVSKTSQRHGKEQQKAPINPLQYALNTLLQEKEEWLKEKKALFEQNSKMELQAAESSRRMADMQRQMEAQLALKGKADWLEMENYSLRDTVADQRIKIERREGMLPTDGKKLTPPPTRRWST